MMSVSVEEPLKRAMLNATYPPFALAPIAPSTRSGQYWMMSLRGT